MTLQPGSRPVPNSADYVLIRKLGAGAFGEVWHAHGPGGLDVALKFIPFDAHGLAQELRSLEAVKSIRHPNLVSLFGVWHRDNRLILAMELCDRSLQDRLTEVLGQKLPGIPVGELLNYLSDAADGLDALNAKQVQHRDVKPANLLLLGSGVKVADFGLAKVLEHTVGSNTGAGPLAYTAPECFKGKLAQQSDQYSLAVTYYHLRTGNLPFRGTQAQIMYAHLELEADLSHLPPTEGAVLARALSKEPGKRWRNCKLFVKELIGAQQPASEILQKDNARFYYNRGTAWLDKEEYDKAIRDLDEAIRLDPKGASAYDNRGVARLGKMEYDKAIEAFNEALHLDPNYAADLCLRERTVRLPVDDFLPKYAPMWFMVRGINWLSKKEYDKAIKDFNISIRFNPEFELPFVHRGRGYFGKKEYGRAIEDFEQAIRQNPEQHTFASCQLAWLLATCPVREYRDGKRAIQMATKACKLAEWENGEELSILAAAYAEAGRFDEAENYQRKALEDPAYRGKDGDEFRRRLELYKLKKPLRQRD
jgi:tetratricopeptide (TPR) repeat protein